jgi:hypothetical protein
MSETLMVWKPQAGLTQANAKPAFIAIAEGPTVLPDDPALHAFLADLLAELPPVESGSERSPWSVTPEVSDGHVALGVSGDIVNTLTNVIDHAFRHGLVVYHVNNDILYDAAWDEAVRLWGLENRRRAGEIE